MYDQDDIARSVRRYVAEMLGPPWAIDLERKEVRDDARPAGLVEVAQSRVRRARVSIPQGNVEMFAPVSVTLYPSLADPREAGRTARVLTHALLQLIVVGADGPTFEDGRPASGPERLPLYDYADVPLTGTAAQRQGPAHPHDLLWAEDYGVRPIQDPQDPQRWTVALDMRVSWEQPGRVSQADLDAPIATAMPASSEPYVRLVVEP